MRRKIYLVFIVFTIFFPNQNIFANNYQIYINKASFTLSLVENNKIIAIYPVAVGRGVKGWPSTPEGSFIIENKSTLSCSKRCSPYGTRFMGLSPSHVGIHGTNQPYKIGTPASHGCIRMFNKDSEDLFKRVYIGTKVKIFSKPPTNKIFSLAEEQVKLFCLFTGIENLNICKLKPLIKKLKGKLIYLDKENLILENEKGYYVNLKINQLKAVDLDNTEIQLDAPVFIYKGSTFGALEDILKNFELSLTPNNEIIKIEDLNKKIKNEVNLNEEKNIPLDENNKINDKTNEINLELNNAN